MIPSQFSLDHRLAALRPTPAQLRIARELDEARAAAIPTGHTIGEPPAARFDTGRATARPSRVPAS